MNPVSDAAQRQRALDPRSSFIVQAPAGSGKTELLTQRFLRLLASVAEPEEIIAITFTRKAAAEMRNRILAALDRATRPPPDKGHERATWELARAALARDQAHDWSLRDNPNRLRVLTFDSLCASLARQLPVLSELGAPPLTEENAQALYRQAARASLARLDESGPGAALAEVLRHLDSQLGLLEELLTGMLARRDQWLPHILETPESEAVEAALRHQVEGHLGALADLIGPSRLSQLARLAGEAAERLPEEKRHIALACCEGQVAPPGPHWEDLPRWQGLTQLVLTDKGGPRSPRGLNKNLGLPPEQKDAKAELSALITELTETPGLVEQLHAVRKLPARALGQEQRRLLDALGMVLLDAAAQLVLVFQEEGRLDFVEVQQRALRALGEPGTPSEVALRLDHRITHLLVDEFQDTSSGQYRLLERLTEGWVPGDGRSLFLVGDPMQSIYRFRKAEVGLFLQAFETGIGDVALEPLRLTMNFRSQAGIVDWVNQAFGGIFPPLTDLTLGGMPYAPSQAIHDPLPGPAVQIHPCAEDDPEHEAQRVVEIVQTSLQADPDGRIAILVRARSHMPAIARALTEAGLRFQAVQATPLADRPTVQDIYSLARALLHPADRLAWLSLLRSPLVGLGFEDIATLCEGAPDPLWSRVRDTSACDRLSPDGQARLARLRQELEPELPARSRRPLRDWVEAIWLALGGTAVGHRDDAQACFDLLEAQQTPLGIADLGGLDEALRGLYAPPDSEAGTQIQLMTMHQSKGLEFETVILPGLGRRTGGNRNELLYWHEVPGPDGDPELLLAPIKGTQQDDEPIVAYLRWIDQQKEAYEQQRLLYVATTRARERLHLLGHAAFARNKDGETPRAPTGSLLAALWPAVAAAFESLTPPGERTARRTGVLAPRKESRLPADWQLVLAPAPPAEQTPPAATAAIDFEWAGDTARHVGTLVHRYLERIAKDGSDHWPTARIDALMPAFRTALAGLGVDPEAMDEAADKVHRSLQRTLCDERGRWILQAHPHAACELALTGLDEQGQPGHFVIDRTFVADGIRWIIDYKTGDHQGGELEGFLDNEQERYRAQLENYGRLMRALEEGPIRLALYFPLLGGWREWGSED